MGEARPEGYINLPFISGPGVLHTYIGGRSRKLGRSILTFSLPPILTCIGSTSHCRGICYGVKGGQAFLTRALKNTRNLIATKKPNFVERMARAIENAVRFGKVRAFRIHVVLL